MKSKKNSKSKEKYSIFSRLKSLLIKKSNDQEYKEESKQALRIDLGLTDENLSLIEKYMSYEKSVFTYTLKMFWLGRFDKINQDEKKFFDWASQKFLPEDIKYKGLSSKNLLIDDQVDIRKEAENLFEKLKSVL